MGRPEAEGYRDVTGIWTVSYGHTSAVVKPNMVVAEAEAEAILRADPAHLTDIGTDSERFWSEFDSGDPILKYSLTSPPYSVSHQ